MNECDLNDPQLHCEMRERCAYILGLAQPLQEPRVLHSFVKMAKLPNRESRGRSHECKSQSCACLVTWTSSVHTYARTTIDFGEAVAPLQVMGLFKTPVEKGCLCAPSLSISYCGMPCLLPRIGAGFGHSDWMSRWRPFSVRLAITWEAIGSVSRNFPSSLYGRSGESALLPSSFRKYWNSKTIRHDTKCSYMYDFFFILFLLFSYSFQFVLLSFKRFPSTLVPFSTYFL
jgi:hypothetical protein